MAEFDWVNARANCSLGLLFEDLKAGTQDDVNKRNAIDNSKYKVTFNNNRISVIHEIEYGLVAGAVRFVMSQNSIEVRDGDDTLKFKATPTLNEKGECRLKVGDKEMEPWCFRKVALEELFFGK